jgi:iron complex transport system ATP-binding protein
MLLNVNNLSAGYPQQPILQQLSFSMSSGEILCLLGPNGSGKTTLLKALMGFLPEVSGEITINNQSLSSLSPMERAKLIAYIPQSHRPVFEYQVFEMVLMGRCGYLDRFAQPGPQDEKIAMDALEQLGIQALATKKYTKLSGGQRQLVLIARALCQQAQLLIMDEPSADLDFANQQLIVQKIHELKANNFSIILSTHAPELPFNTADQVLMLKQGRLLEFGPPCEVLTAKSLQQLYGIPMDVVSICDSTGAPRRLCIPV